MAKNGFSMSNRVAVESITASKTLTQDDCGKVLIMGSASAAYTVTLPTAADALAGWNCTFIVGATAKDHIITGSQESAPNIYFVGGGNSVFTAAADYSGSGGTADSKLTFNNAEMVQGDRVEFVTDGSDWHAKVITLSQEAYTLA
jgi:hypothetical protein